MRDELRDMLKKVPPSFGVVLVSGDEELTRFRGSDEDKTYFFEGRLNKVQADFRGEFGISNLGMLSGLLNFPNYKAEEATFTVKRQRKGDVEMVREFQLRNPVTGNAADFRTTDPRHIQAMANVKDVPWEVSFSPSKAKITEFSQIAGLYSDVDKYFTVRSEDNGDLSFAIGTEDTSSHRSNTVFAPALESRVRAPTKFRLDYFLGALKQAGGENATVSITSHGLLCVSSKDETGEYFYYLRSHVG